MELHALQVHWREPAANLFRFVSTLRNRFFRVKLTVKFTSEAMNFSTKCAYLIMSFSCNSSLYNNQSGRYTYGLLAKNITDPFGVAHQFIISPD